MQTLAARLSARRSQGAGSPGSRSARSGSRGVAKILATLALAWAGAAAAEVAITDRTRHYPLHANTLQALRDALQAGIPEAQPDHPSGMTVAKLQWEANYAPTPTGCHVATHRVALDITTVLPEWRERARATARLRRQWDRTYAALAAHEAGHRDLSIASARELDTLVAGFSSTSRNSRARCWKCSRR
jgi:predicted secreted Zn-dependent protease